MLVTVNNKKSKWDPIYKGPYRVESLPSDVTAVMGVGRESRRYHRDQLKLAKGLHENTPPEIIPSVVMDASQLRMFIENNYTHSESGTRFE